MTRAKDISKILTDADISGTLDVSGAFTSQGIDDNADATAITIDNSESVGLGTSAPFNSRPGSLTISNQAPTLYLEDTNSTGSDVGQILYSNGDLFYDTGNRNGTGTSGSTTHFTIKNSGNVGISNSSPVEMLTIGSTSDSASRIQFLTATNGANTIHFGDGTSADAYRGYINYAHDTDSLQFASGGSERLRISSDGSLFYGTTSNVETNDLGVAIDAGDNFMIRHGLNSTATQDRVRFYNANGLIGKIQTTGSATAYVTSSDYRLKESITYDFDATTRLKQLKPCRFNFIADADTTVDGFLAHEVQSVVPEAISGTHNEVDADGNAVMQGIDQSKLVPLLVKTIQELEARITALEGA